MAWAAFRQTRWGVIETLCLSDMGASVRRLWPNCQRAGELQFLLLAGHGLEPIAASAGKRRTHPIRCRPALGMAFSRRIRAYSPVFGKSEITRRPPGLRT